MVRDIVVPLQFGASDTAALDAASALAVAHEAHVALLAAVSYPAPIASEWGMAASMISQVDFNRMLDSVREAGEKAKLHVERAGASCELRLVQTLLNGPEEAAAMHARHADIAVIGGSDTVAPDPRFSAYFSALLLDAGRPVLVVPPSAKLLVPPRRVVLAWQPRREPSRAIHDALALLPRDARVDVLMIDPEVGESSHGQQPGADIAAHLARHGLQVKVVVLQREGGSKGAAILDYAEQQRADLVVMGGYGHSRWRQQVLGGTTRTVLEQATMPVFFSH